MTDLLLSDIIKTAPKFSFFEELVSMPSTTTELQAHDFLKINKIIDDIGLYLKELEVIFKQVRVSNIESRISIDWYYEGVEQIYDLNRNLDNVDSVISRLLLVLELPINAKHLQYTHLLSKCEEITDVSLEVKKHLVSIKRKIDISINYKELKDMTMETLTREIEDGVKLFLQLKDLQVATQDGTEARTPHLPESVTLQEVIHKMQISNSNNFSMKSVVLPTFNERDEATYKAYIALETKLEPLKVSINFLPLRIEEFLNICGDNFPACIREINDNFDKLVDQWDYLNDSLHQFIGVSIYPKWEAVFRFIISETTRIVDSLIHEFTIKVNRRITKKIGESYKLCSNAINIIKKSVSEGLVKKPETVTSFNEVVLTKWGELNQCLVLNQNFDDISNYTNDSTEFSGLKQFQTMRSVSSPTKASVVTSPRKRHGSDDISTGLGIDLGIDIEAPQVPFSIRNANKINDFGPEIGKSAKPSLLHEFKLTTKHRSISNPLPSSKDEDEETLVSKAAQYEEDDMNKLIKRVESMSIKQPKRRKRHVSKIPTIVKDYIKKGYPIIPKPKVKQSRIPVIAPAHKVFLSPTKSVKSVDSDYTEHLNSPIRLEKLRSKKSPSRIQSDPASTRTKAPAFNLRSPSLNLTSTPNLAYPDSVLDQPSPVYNNSAGSNSPGFSGRSRSSTGTFSARSQSPNNLSPRRISPISYRSTSPERPGSSIGSRFDDEHLLQPLKHIKPAWK